jgi:hypothetical protein
VPAAHHRRCNHAFATMIPSNFNVLDVYVGDKGSPLSKPGLP